MSDKDDVDPHDLPHNMSEVEGEHRDLSKIDPDLEHNEGDPDADADADADGDDIVPAVARD